MAKATYNGVVLAESDNFEIVEGNVYFPPESVNMDYFTETSHHTNCPWKGLANYYTVEADGDTLDNVAWFYPEPKKAANNITSHVAFYTNKVKVER